jgi:hypothetical protein
MAALRKGIRDGVAAGPQLEPAVEVIEGDQPVSYLFGKFDCSRLLWHYVFLTSIPIFWGIISGSSIVLIWRNGFLRNFSIIPKHGWGWNCIHSEHTDSDYIATTHNSICTLTVVRHTSFRSSCTSTVPTTQNLGPFWLKTSKAVSECSKYQIHKYFFKLTHSF